MFYQLVSLLFLAAEEIEISVGDGFVAVEEEELRFVGLKMDAPVVQSERRLGLVVVDENVEDVDRFGSELLLLVFLSSKFKLFI